MTDVQPMTVEEFNTWLFRYENRQTKGLPGDWNARIRLALEKLEQLEAATTRRTCLRCGQVLRCPWCDFDAGPLK